MGPDKTNFLAQVISVGIITFAVTQDTLGVPRVCLGKPAPYESSRVTNGRMRSQGKGVGQMLHGHSFTGSSILPLTGIPQPTPCWPHTGGKAPVMQLQSRDNSPSVEGAHSGSTGATQSKVLNKSLQEARSQ